MSDIQTRPFIVHLVIAVCNGCQSERSYEINPPFLKAEDFIAWQKSGAIDPCSCGFPTADLKLRIDDPN